MQRATEDRGPHRSVGRRRSRRLARVVACAAQVLACTLLLTAPSEPGAAPRQQVAAEANAAAADTADRQSRRGRGRQRSRDSESEPPSLPQVSYLEIARRAVMAGDDERAAEVLLEARACWREHAERCGFARVDYQALVGVVYLDQGEYEKAAQALAEVTELQPQRSAAWLYLGQARYQLGRHAEALQALRKVGTEARKVDGYHALVARAELGVGQPEAARETLLRGLRLFPDDRVLLRELTTLYARHGLFRTAAAIGRRYLAASSGETLALLLVADALRSAGRPAAALVLLEEAQLRDPTDREVLAHLAYTYAEADHPYAAAQLFDRLSHHEARFAFEAAEQYRLVGRYRQALHLNRRVPDIRRRLGQQLAILLGTEAYDQAAGLVDTLRGAHALDDVARYRLAYAALRAHRLGVAEHLLDEISQAAWKDSGRKLRQVLVACQDHPASCP